MGAFGGLILTNRGRNLQVKAQTGVELHFTRIAIGDGDLGGSSILELNALKNERKSLEITKLKVLTGGQAVVGSVLNNQDITAGFYFREIGVFATDPDVGEILYCYANAGSTADYIPAGSDGSTDLIEKTIDIVTLVGNAANVTATINESLIYETPAGAQEKADQAEQNAKEYADQQLAAHSANTTIHITSAERTAWNQAEANAKAYTDSAPETMQRNIGNFNVYKSGKDSNGIFTTVEYKRPNGTLYARSVLSSGTSPQYTTRTVTYYAADGTTVIRTDTYTLTYDTDGDLISEVKQ
ncbi:phage tail protein [Bacillus sp. FSL W8-0223]|uniref:phage tail-collar fiber domain-containing protein n=1 Tax=Bacillus sp. FSL W8-0223 TaxID=2954595 RepID=UPI0030FA1131